MFLRQNPAAAGRTGFVGRFVNLIRAGKPFIPAIKLAAIDPKFATVSP